MSTVVNQANNVYSKDTKQTFDNAKILPIIPVTQLEDELSSLEEEISLIDLKNVSDGIVIQTLQKQLEALTDQIKYQKTIDTILNNIISKSDKNELIFAIKQLFEDSSFVHIKKLYCRANKHNFQQCPRTKDLYPGQWTGLYIDKSKEAIKDMFMNIATNFKDIKNFSYNNVRKNDPVKEHSAKSHCDGLVTWTVDDAKIFIQEELEIIFEYTKLSVADFGCVPYP